MTARELTTAAEALSVLNDWRATEEGRCNHVRGPIRCGVCLCRSEAISYFAAQAAEVVRLDREHDFALIAKNAAEAEVEALRAGAAVDNVLLRHLSARAEAAEADKRRLDVLLSCMGTLNLAECLDVPAQGDPRAMIDARDAAWKAEDAALNTKDPT